MDDTAPVMGDIPPVLSHPPSPLLLTGPDSIGYLISYALFGALGVQIYVYYLRYPSDSRVLKTFVLAIFLVEMITTSLMTYSAWKTFVYGWGSPLALMEIPWSSAALNPIAGCLFSSIHVFYAWRLHRLDKAVMLPLVVILSSLGQLGICLYVSTEFARASSLMDVGGALDNVYIAWLSTSAFCDLLICGSLLHTLYGAQRQLAMGPTRPLISRVITLTMETTTLTTVAAVVSAILSATLPMTRFHFMMFLILMKLYSNTLLVTLNARSARGRSLEGSTEVVFWSDMSDVPPSRTRVGQTATSATTSLPAMQFAVPLQDRRSEDCEGRRSYRDTPADGVSIRKEDEVSPSEHWV